MKRKTNLTVMHSGRDIGKLGYGSGGHADSPWARQGIFVMGGDLGKKHGGSYGGPGLPLSRRKRVENPKLKAKHKLVLVNGLCLHCNMMSDGHKRLMESL